jgi:MoaA/NifB/PqqE/SkfB family radical SAM enzyme
MKTSRAELRYAQEHFNEVHHTTLNPDGPGVVRIHLVPPKITGKTLEASVAILNGQDVIPVNVSWSILLTELIEQINFYHGREISDDDFNRIMDRTCRGVKKVYPFVSKKRIKEDAALIMDTFKRIARGEEVEAPIAFIDIGEYAPFMKAPHRMDLMVSAMTKDGHWNCNHQCVHCYAAGQPHAEEKELTTAEWKSVIEKCRNIGIPQLTFTGGEPTMRADLIQLIEYAKWFVTRLNTNGRKLTPEYCEKLQRASLDSVQITFYSDKEEIHNKLVGAPGFNDTVAGIKNALAAGLSVSINTPLCTLNRDYVETLKYLHELGVTYVTCSGLITTGNATGAASTELQLTNKDVREILKESVDYCFANGMEISFTSPGWVDADFCNELGITTPNCGACLSNMAITPSGNIVPCQSWLSDEPLGNILKDEWDEVWESERCKERRKYSSGLRSECPLRIIREVK